LTTRKNDALFTWIEIARSISTLFSLLFLALAHFVEVVLYHSRAALGRKQEQAQRARIDSEVANLSHSLKLRIAAANFPDREGLFDLLIDTIKTFELPEHPRPYPTKHVWKAFNDLAWQLYEDEGFAKIDPPAYGNEIEKARYADYLLALDSRLKNPRETLDAFLDAIARSFVLFAQRLPASAFAMGEDGAEPPPMFQVSVAETLSDLPDVVHRVIAPLASTRTTTLGLFSKLESQLVARSNSHRPALPPIEEYRGTPRAMIDAYLKDTPLHALFDVMIPFDIAPEIRLEHWHLLAPTGWGKTQTLQHIIYRDITGPDPPALVIIEPKGDMVATIQRLKLFTARPDRLLVIDPELSPALNMFAIPNERRKRYSQTIQEQIEASIVQQYGYIFSALDADMSHKQSTALSYVVKLIVAMQGSILDFINVLNDPSKELSKSPFEKHVRALDDVAQGFFETQFFNAQSFGMTRRSLGSKLYGLLAVPAFKRMFLAKENHLDMFERLQTPGSVTVVNTAKGLLKREASSLFGRYMIAQATNAAFERVAIPERERKAAYLIIDEAGSYFDDSLEELLAEVRSMGVGVLFAHQLMSQLKTRALKSSVLGQTRIKFAAPAEDDASEIAPSMHTSADFLRSMRQSKGKSTQFGVYVRGHTPTAVRLQVPFLTMENAPQISAAEHEALRRRTHARYSDQPPAATPPAAAVATPPPEERPPPPTSDDAVHSTPSKEW
jgi:hypothetical protein